MCKNDVWKKMFFDDDHDDLHQDELCVKEFQVKKDKTNFKKIVKWQGTKWNE